MREGFDIRNEELLLLRLCRLAFNDQQRNELKKLTGSVTDWNYFTMKANDHGVIALIYSNLLKFDLLGFIPPEIVSDMNNKSLVNLSRNSFHTTVITEVQKLFNDSGIKLVLLKGLALEYSVYGNEGLRQMTDIDFLINRADYKKAQQIFFNAGYEQLPVKSLLHKPIISFLGKHLPSFIKNGASLDIHIELFPGTKNDLTQQLFGTSQQVNINDRIFSIPPPQLFFIYLIKHLQSHELTNESQLRLYTDLAVMAEKYYDRIFDEKLIVYSSNAGLPEIVAEKLKLLQDFWSFSYPENIDSFIRNNLKQDPQVRFLGFLNSPKNNAPADSKILYKKTINEIPGLHRKLLYIAGDIFPTLSFMKERYRVGTRFYALFYYPHRLGKIFWLLSG